MVPITKYGSTVYIRMNGNGLSSIIPYIRKFQFSLSFPIQSDF